MELTSPNDSALEDELDMAPKQKSCSCLKSPKHRVTFVIALWGFLTSTERAIILPTLWLYLKTFWSLQTAREFYAGTMAAFSLAVLVATPICGFLATRGVRVKLILIVCNHLELIGNVVYLFAPYPVLVLIGRLIAGFGAGCEPPLFADLARTTTTEERTRYTIITLLCRQFGLVFGPVFTLALSKVSIVQSNIYVDVHNGPGLIMAILWALHTLLAIFIYPNITEQGQDEEVKLLEPGKKRLQSYIRDVCIASPSKEKKTPTSHLTWQQVYLRYEILTLLFLSFNCYFSLMSLETVLSPLANLLFNWTEVNVSYVYLACSILVLFVFVALHVLTGFASDWALAVFGAWTMSFAYLWIAISVGLVSGPYQLWQVAIPITGIMVHVIGIPFAVACSESLYTKLLPMEYMNQAQTVLRTVLNTAYLVGPFIGGTLYFVAPAVFSIMSAGTIIAGSLLVARRSVFIPPASESA